ncbi:MAG: hypothetical protein HQL39_07165 [Alphaproteobacteria bacterium]|nr:hypothetical protein [Alphaproteobacteria bacterium]
MTDENVKASEEPVKAKAPKVKASAIVDDERMVALEALVERQAAELKTVRYEINGSSSKGVVAMMIGLLALGAAVTVPMWGSEVVVNDLQSTRTLALATAHLHQAARQSAPFSADLDMVRKAVRRDADAALLFTAIEPAAKAGVPTVAQLADQFHALSDRIVLGNVAATGSYWVDSAFRAVTSGIDAVNVSLGGETLTREMGLVIETHRALEAGDLAKAITTVEQLGGDSGQTATAWLGKAKLRLALDEALGKLDKLAAKRATQRPGFSL